MANIDLPTIGDIIMSPHSKVLDASGNDKYNLLACDGSAVDEGLHPVLYTKVKKLVSGRTFPPADYKAYAYLTADPSSEEELTGNLTFAATSGSVTYSSKGVSTSIGHLQYTTNVDFSLDWTIAFTGFTSVSNTLAISVLTAASGDYSPQSIEMRLLDSSTYVVDVIVEGRGRQSLIVSGISGLNKDVTPIVSYTSNTKQLRVEWVENGNLIKTTSKTLPTAPYGTATGFRVGYHASSSKNFGGSIRELALFQRVVGYEEIFGGNETHLFPTLAPLDPRVPYKIVGDLT